jgi:WD40 repeat protein
MTLKNIVMILIVLIVIACSAPQQPTVEPAAPVVETVTSAPTITPTVIPSPSLAPTATSENLAPINFDLEPITVENAENLVEIADWKHLKGFSSIAFSPDGQYLLAGLSKGDVKMWHLPDGNLMFTLSSHSKEVLDVEFSPDGKLIASGSTDNTVRLWDATNGELLKTLEGHSGKVFDIDFSPDSTQLASASFDKTARVWNVEDGSLFLELTGHTEGVFTVAYSPDGSVIATAARDKTTRIWDPTNGNLVTTLDFSKLSTSPFNLAAAFSPDGEQLAVRNGFNSSVSIFSAGGYELEKKITPPGIMNNTLFLFSPDESVLITGSQHWGLNVVDAETGGNLIELTHQGGLRTATLSPDGKVLASIDRNLYLYVWGIRP